MSDRSWRAVLADEPMSRSLRDEIELFTTQLEARRQGRLEENVFAETRLRRGVYGQRYDNGQRHDGVASRSLDYPERPTKGPNTVWDAPGMMRIKLPYGRVTARQLEVIAELAEEYADGVLHPTTRQDIQLHFVHIDDTPDLMLRLAAVGVTTREACGNSVRNVTACPMAGVCTGETFDVTPYAHALAFYLMGHPDAQGFGRKFKVAFSGCDDQPCGLTSIHDLGLIARTRRVDGELQRGFELWVGGGLGAVPHQAKLLEPFVAEQELLAMSQAICRVFARHGEKKNRARARLKFVVAKLGIDAFRELVRAERAALPDDPRWTDYIQRLDRGVDGPREPSAPRTDPEVDTEDRVDPASGAAPTAWRRTNVQPQKQAGYVAVTVALPLGDATAEQARALADIARRFCGDTLRVTVEQNFLLRWVREEDLPALYQTLSAAQLAQPGGGTIVDVTACPGTDTCKLGIASSRGLAAELRRRLTERSVQLDRSISKLRIKISGCFNSCGQHHVADIGFYGVSRKVGGYAVPHFQVVVGGMWSENGGAFGLAIGAVPSKRIPEAVTLLTDRFLAERQGDESFQAFVRRRGKAAVKSWLSALTEVPPHEQDRTLYADWSDAREFTLGDLGVGECAGQVVSVADFGLADSERVAFEAQLELDASNDARALELAYEAMLRAARSLVQTEKPDVGDAPEEVVQEFRRRFFDTKLFFDRFAGGKFASYLFRAHEESAERATPDGARQRIEEAQLFIEAAHACHARLG